MKKENRVLRILKTGFMIACILSLFSLPVTNGAMAKYEPPKAPKVLFFTANQDEIAPGDTVTLTWYVLNATSVDILGIEKVAECIWPLIGKTEVQPTKTSTYILTATGPGGTASASVTVNVIEETTPAIINSFAASAEEIDEGDEVTLEWDVSDASLVTIDSEEVEAKGTMVLTPSETTTYVLEAIGTDDVVVTESVTVTVIPKPEIISFESSATTVEKGTLVTLKWDTENATICEIVTDDGLKLANRPAEGQISITPNKTKTYTLIAYNVNEVTVEESITITVEE